MTENEKLYNEGLLEGYKRAIQDILYLKNKQWKMKIPLIGEDILKMTVEQLTKNYEVLINKIEKR